MFSKMVWCTGSVALAESFVCFAKTATGVDVSLFSLPHSRIIKQLAVNVSFARIPKAARWHTFCQRIKGTRQDTVVYFMYVFYNEYFGLVPISFSCRSY